MPDSLKPDYFDKVYAASADPWNFETSDYERAKYTDTLASLPRKGYEKAFEIGCSIGVLTKLLAERCETLLATDVSEKALQQARERCKELTNITFRQMEVPHEFPTESYDLTVLSEVAYYWNREGVEEAARKIRNHTRVGGQVILVHWTPKVHDYPLTGDEVHEIFLANANFVHLTGHRAEKYRLDVLGIK